ncbi:MAG: 6,7-dimethyl-8-ribityllumazine synthase [Planctomycetaceae bacterium]|jgi:6,7-dimethyl-8-ribityllumazine synthase|nr:6,7-dimethyl-8-ribityllumazine synthase [Planctomycetaceae bacterium]
MREYSGHICQPPEGYIVIVVARFNKSITQRLLDGAIAKLRQHNVREQDIHVAWTPGAYETPFVASYFANDMNCLAVICLGAVIKGETSHDQHISRAVSMALWEISSATGTPVIFGILTCDNIEQANARSGIIESAKDKSIDPAPGNKGAEAAEAALEMIDLITELPDISEQFPTNINNMFANLLGGFNNENNNDKNKKYKKKQPFYFDIGENNYANDDDDNDDDNDYIFNDECKKRNWETRGNIFFEQPKKFTKKVTKKQKKKKNK